jgi:hypothetical protein
LPKNILLILAGLVTSESAFAFGTDWAKITGELTAWRAIEALTPCVPRTAPPPVATAGVTYNGKIAEFNTKSAGHISNIEKIVADGLAAEEAHTARQQARVPVGSLPAAEAAAIQRTSAVDANAVNEAKKAKLAQINSEASACVTEATEIGVSADAALAMDGVSKSKEIKKICSRIVATASRGSIASAVAGADLGQMMQLAQMGQGLLKSAQPAGGGANSGDYEITEDPSGITPIDSDNKNGNSLGYTAGDPSNQPQTNEAGSESGSGASTAGYDTGATDSGLNLAGDLSATTDPKKASGSSSTGASFGGASAPGATNVAAGTAMQTASAKSPAEYAAGEGSSRSRRSSLGLTADANALDELTPTAAKESRAPASFGAKAKEQPVALADPETDLFKSVSLKIREYKNKKNLLL